MAYNLNYNPGTEYDKHVRHRKVLIKIVVVLAVLTLLFIIFMGWRNWKDNNGDSITTDPNFTQLTDQQKNELEKNMTATSSSTLSKKEEEVLIRSTSARPSSNSTSTDSRGTLTEAEQRELMRAMTAQ